MRFGSSDFAERCDFNRNPPIFSNHHHWQQQQHVMFSRLCKYYFNEPSRLVYTSDFGARFRSKLVRSSKYNYFYIYENGLV